jgi:hypothetical protein
LVTVPWSTTCAEAVPNFARVVTRVMVVLLVFAFASVRPVSKPPLTDRLVVACQTPVDESGAERPSPCRAAERTLSVISFPDSVSVLVAAVGAAARSVTLPSRS